MAEWQPTKKAGEEVEETTSVFGTLKRKKVAKGVDKFEEAEAAKADLNAAMGGDDAQEAKTPAIVEDASNDDVMEEKKKKIVKECEEFAEADAALKEAIEGYDEQKKGEAKNIVEDSGAKTEDEVDGTQKKQAIVKECENFVLVDATLHAQVHVNGSEEAKEREVKVDGTQKKEKEMAERFAVMEDMLCHAKEGFDSPVAEESKADDLVMTESSLEGFNGYEDAPETKAVVETTDCSLEGAEAKKGWSVEEVQTAMAHAEASLEDSEPCGLVPFSSDDDHDDPLEPFMLKVHIRYDPEQTRPEPPVDEAPKVDGREGAIHEPVKEVPKVDGIEEDLPVPVVETPMPQTPEAPEEALPEAKEVSKVDYLEGAVPELPVEAPKDVQEAVLAPSAKVPRLDLLTAHDVDEAPLGQAPPVPSQIRLPTAPPVEPMLPFSITFGQVRPSEQVETLEYVDAPPRRALSIVKEEEETMAPEETRSILRGMVALPERRGHKKNVSISNEITPAPLPNGDVQRGAEEEEQAPRPGVLRRLLGWARRRFSHGGRRQATTEVDGRRYEAIPDEEEAKEAKKASKKSEKKDKKDKKEKKGGKE